MNSIILLRYVYAFHSEPEYFIRSFKKIFGMQLFF